MSDKNHLTSFPERLKKVIGEESINKSAKRCGLTPTALANYLKGSSLPGLENLVSIATEFEVNVGWLATGEGPKRGTYTKAQEPESLTLKRRPFTTTPDGGIYCMEFGDNVKRWRESKGFSIEQIVNKLDLNIDDYNAIESGYLPSSDFLLGELTTFFGCDPGYLIYGESFSRKTNSVKEVSFSSEFNLSLLDSGIKQSLGEETIDLRDTQFYIIENNTMSPTLSPGDIAICRNDYLHISDGLFSINLSGQKEVRRITKSLNSKVIVSCDNELYASFSADQEEVEKLIVGTVIYLIKLNF